MIQWCIFFVIVLLLGLLPVLIRKTAIDEMGRKSEKIYIGMTENEMLRIMGRKYTRSLLSDNKTKYEWRYGAVSHSYKGYRSYSGVSKIDIYVKNGKVISVSGLNI